MKNYVQPGENITVTAEAAATSGDGVRGGTLFGITSADAEIGDPLVLVTETESIWSSGRLRHWSGRKREHRM